MLIAFVRNLSLLAVLMTFLLLPGQRRAEAAEVVRVNGSGSMMYVMKPLARVYMKAHPNVRIELEKPIGSSGAVKALLAGAIEIAVSSKLLKPEQIAGGAISNEYGKMPLTIVTGMKVAKTNITTRELEDIYSGRLRAWPDGEPIRLVLRPDADIDTRILESLSPGMARAVKDARQQHGMIVAVTDPESDELLSKTPGSLGASTLAASLLEKYPLNVLSLNGIKPSTRALADGSYPLAKDFRFITTGKTSAAAHRFIDFIYSPQGRAITEKYGVLVTTGSRARH